LDIRAANRRIYLVQEMGWYKEKIVQFNFLWCAQYKANLFIKFIVFKVHLCQRFVNCDVIYCYIDRVFVRSLCNYPNWLTHRTTRSSLTKFDGQCSALEGLLYVFPYDGHEMTQLNVSLQNFLPGCLKSVSNRILCNINISF